MLLEASSATTVSPVRSSTRLRFVWGLVLVTLLGLGLKLWGMAPFIESMDGVFFARGTLDYSVLEIRPQWPGYPVYIALGTLLERTMHNPVLALHLISVCSSALVAPLLGTLAWVWSRSEGTAEPQALWAGWAAAGLWTVLPLGTVAGTEIYSDPLALLLMLAQLAVLMLARARGGVWLYLLSGLLAALMVGARLSYLPLLVMNLALLWGAWRAQGRSSLGWILGFAVGCAAWLGAQVALEGMNYFNAMRGHLSGHYGQWGQTLGTDPDPASRPMRALRTVIVYGLHGVWPSISSPTRILSTLLWGLLGLLALSAVILQLKKQGTRGPHAGRWTWALGTLTYLIWIYVSHDLEIDRYWLPLGAALTVALALPLARLHLLPLVLVPVLLGLGYAGTRQALERSTQPHLDIQVAQYLSVQAPQGAVYLLAAENSLTASYLRPDVEVVPFDSTWNQLYAQAENVHQQGRVVYTVLEGPAQEVRGWYPLAIFCKSASVRTREPSWLTLYQYAQPPRNLSVQGCHPVSGILPPVRIE